MNDIRIFNNPQFGEIRTAGTAENPLFCLVDVCNALGLQQGHVRERLNDGVVSTEPIVDNLGRTQQANFVNEDGLYDVILDSRKPEAKAFRKWVTSEVLPSIRKHGMYATPDTIEEMLQNPDNMIKILTTLKEERQQRKIAESKVELLEQVTAEQAPKVVFANAVAGSTNSILIGELAKLLRQNGIPMGEKRMFQWLRENGFLGSHGERYNIPNQRYLEQGLFTLKTNTFSVNGEMKTRNTTKVTGKGQEYFINKFLADKTVTVG